MHKIPTLILALLILASNIICAPICAQNAGEIGVYAIVLEHITLRRVSGKFMIETNSKNSLYFYQDNVTGRSVLVARY